MNKQVYRDFQALKHVLATARFPLFARAQAEKTGLINELYKDVGLFLDEKSQRNFFWRKTSARQVLKKIGYTETEIDDEDLDVVNYKIVNLRMVYFDYVVKSFIEKKNCSPIVIDLGCGLDERLYKFSHKDVLWFNIDYPNIIKLRQQVFGESIYTQKCFLNKQLEIKGEKVFSIAMNVNCFLWTDIINRICTIKGLELHKSPVLLIAIGVFPYLEETCIWEIFEKIQQFSPDFEVVFEDFTQEMIKRILVNTDVTKTGAIAKTAFSPKAQLKIKKKDLKLAVKKEFVYFSYPNLWKKGDLDKYLSDPTKGTFLLKKDEISSRIIHVGPVDTNFNEK